MCTLRRKSKINSTCGPCGPAIHGHFSRLGQTNDVPILGKDDILGAFYVGNGWESGNGIGIMDHSLIGL